MNFIKSKKGFTLIELIVVIAILGILAMVAVPRVVGAIKNARINTLKQNLDIVNKAISADVAQNGALPADAAAVNTLLSGKTLANMGMTYLINTPANGAYTLSVAATGAPYNLATADITFSTVVGASVSFAPPYIVTDAATASGAANAAKVADGSTGPVVELQNIKP